MSRLLTVREVGLRLGLSPAAVRRRIAAEELHAIDVGFNGQHAWRIEEEELVEYQRRRSHQGQGRAT